MRRSLLFLALLAMAFTASARSEEKTAPEEKAVVVARIVYHPTDKEGKEVWSELRYGVARGDSLGSIWMPDSLGRWNVHFSIDNERNDVFVQLSEARGLTLGSSAETPVSLKENIILETELPLEWNTDIVFFRTDSGTMTIRLSKEGGKPVQ